jgi:hypothetical protein
VRQPDVDAAARKLPQLDAEFSVVRRAIEARLQPGPAV